MVSCNTGLRGMKWWPLRAAMDRGIPQFKAKNELTRHFTRWNKSWIEIWNNSQKYYSYDSQTAQGNSQRTNYTMRTVISGRLLLKRPNYKSYTLSISLFFDSEAVTGLTHDLVCLSRSANENDSYITRPCSLRAMNTISRNVWNRSENSCEGHDWKGPEAQIKLNICWGVWFIGSDPLDRPGGCFFVANYWRKRLHGQRYSED